MADLFVSHPPREAPPSAGPDPGAARGGLRRTFAALRHPNYRLWFGGQLVSMIGTWMHGMAQGFLVYELTRSSAYVGYVSFAAGLPAWLFMLGGGVIADRVSRRSLLVVTQTAAMLLALVLAVLTLGGWVRPWHILALSFGQGVALAFDAPARQAFVVDLVAREELTNAIALNSMIFNSATTLGPALAGVLYALVGPGWCFAINAASFVAVVGALLRMRLPPPTAPRRTSRSALAELREGLRYAIGHSVIRLLLVGEAAVSLLGVSAMTLMPAWAVKVLHGHARTNGLLLSARGIGSLAGAAFVASRPPGSARGRLLAVGSLLLPASLLVFAALRWLPLSLLSLVAVGLGVMICFNSLNALVQGHVRDELRGRVMSIYTLTFFGLMPIGALIAGSLAVPLGEPTTVVLNAGLLGALAIFAWLRFPALRRLI